MSCFYCCYYYGTKLRQKKEVGIELGQEILIFN